MCTTSGRVKSVRSIWNAEVHLTFTLATSGNQLGNLRVITLEKAPDFLLALRNDPVRLRLTGLLFLILLDLGLLRLSGIVTFIESLEIVSLLVVQTRLL